MSVTSSNYRQQLIQLLTTCRTLHLAVMDDEQPAISLVPYWFDDGIFWILVSELSVHTRALQKGEPVSVLIYNNETTPVNPFAVFRVHFSCLPECVDRSRYSSILEAMNKKLGETVSVLQQLGDFHLCNLQPTSGRLIAGFGQAFSIDGVGMTVLDAPISSQQ